MKVLVFTTVFPNPSQPLHGLFVAERTLHASRLADTTVVSPVPWYRRPGRFRPETDGSMAVDYPAFFYVPGVFKVLDGVLLFLSSLRRVRRLRRRFDFDVIDAHFGFPDGVAAALLGAWFRRPVMVTLRGSELDMVEYRMRRAVLGLALRRVDRVVAVSTQLADLARQLGVPADRVRVIGNGVDLERFRPIERARARQELGVSDGTRLIVSVGHLARVKGFELVVRAMPEIVAAHGQAHFTIVGGPAASSGAYPEQLTAEVERLGLADRVTVTGSVAPGRVALWLSAADVFVLASEREGSPNALREALACGCPVVTSGVGDAPELVPPHCGLMVKDRSAVRHWSEALTSALDRQWDRTAIRREAERHTWTAVAARVAAEWQSCIGADNGGTRGPSAAAQLR